MKGFIKTVDKWDGIRTELKITGDNGVFYKLELLHADRIARSLFVGARVTFPDNDLAGVVCTSTKGCTYGAGHGSLDRNIPKDLIPIPKDKLVK